jgi:hypothetical protein
VQQRVIIRREQHVGILDPGVGNSSFSLKAD